MSRESEEIRGLAYINKYMLNKLRENSHKPHWNHFSNSLLFTCLNAEVGELALAVMLGDPIKIAKEAADVANYAMFIADKNRQKNIFEEEEISNGNERTGNSTGICKRGNGRAD